MSSTHRTASHLSPSNAHLCIRFPLLTPLLAVRRVALYLDATEAPHYISLHGITLHSGRYRSTHRGSHLVEPSICGDEEVAVEVLLVGHFREWKGRQGKAREGKGREGKGREGKGREDNGGDTDSTGVRQRNYSSSVALETTCLYHSDHPVWSSLSPPSRIAAALRRPAKVPSPGIGK